VDIVLKKETNNKEKRCEKEINPIIEENSSGSRDTKVVTTGVTFPGMGNWEHE